MSTFNGGPQSIVTNGLVLYLDAANRNSYVSGSTMWNNLGSSQSTGSLINGPSFNSENGGSIVFDAVNDLVTCGATTGYNTTIGTISAWIYPGAIASGVIFGQYNNDVNRLNINHTSNSFINFFSGNSVVGVLSLTSLNTAPVSRWTCVTVTYDFITDNFAIYINGILSNSTVNSTVPNIDAVGEIMIGCNKDFDNPSPYYQSFFNGRISVVNVYNRVLSASEILQNYTSAKARYGL